MTIPHGDPDFPPDHLLVPDDDGTEVDPHGVGGSDDEPMLTPEDAPDGLTSPESPIP